MLIDETKVGLLLRSNTIPGSTIFSDSSPHEHVLAAVGNVHHVSSADNFGATAIDFDGSGDFISATVDESCEFEDTFTVAFIITPTYNDLGNIYSARGVSSTGLSVRCFANRFNVFYANGSGSLSSTSTYTAGVPQHWACVRDNTGTVTLYIDGVANGTYSWSGVTINQDILTCTIGGYGGEDLDATIKELIITKEALWLTDFTPPTATYAASFLFSGFSQSIATEIALHTDQRSLVAAKLSYGFYQVISQAKKLSVEYDQKFDTAIPLYLPFDMSFDGMAAVQIAFEQIVQCFGPPVALEFLQTWYNYGYNEAILPFVQVIDGQVNSSIQQLQFSVTVAGVRIGVTACTFDRSGFAVIASITLRLHGDWSNKVIGDYVVLTWLGEQYSLVVVDKPSQGQVGQGAFENGYILECMSITFQLSEVFNNDLSASRVTLSYPSGTLATEILDDLTTGVCSYSLNVPDFPVGAFEFDDSERYAALLQVFPASYGWVLNTDKNGVLQISSFQFPGSSAVQKSLYFTSKSLTPPEGILYNKVSIKNFDQASGTTGLRLEVVDNGDGAGTIHGYSVPWNQDFSIYDSEDSSAPSLIIQGGSVEEAEVTDGNIEFVDFAASLSKPCYSTLVFEWGGNDSLDPINFDESGGLVTDIEPGYSVATSSTYTTRRKTWTYDNRRTDPTQARIEYD